MIEALEFFFTAFIILSFIALIGFVVNAILAFFGIRIGDDE